MGSIAPSDIPPLDPTDAIVSAIGEGISAAADAVGNAGDIAGSAASAAAEVAGSAATGLGEGCLGCGCSAAVSLGMLVLTGAAAAATLYR